MPAPAWQLLAGNNLSDLGSPSAALSNLGLLSLVATTGTTGYTLVNGTGTVISWTAPNDGNLHRFQVVGAIHVTSTETGGQVTIAYTLPDGTATSHTLFAAGLAAGDQVPGLDLSIPVKANTAVTISQASALTAGAAIAWAEIWAL